MTETRVHRLARQIADHLPLGWRYDPHKSKENFCAFIRDDCHVLRLRITDGRLVVTGVWPQQVKGPERMHPFAPDNHGYTLPRITCNPDREPNALARDIKRRFLPDYVWLYDEMVRRRDKKLAELDRLAEVLTLFVKAGATDTKGSKAFLPYKGPDFPNGDIEVTVNGDGEKIALDLSAIPLETALWIVAEVADCRRAIRLARMEQT